MFTFCLIKDRTNCINVISEYLNTAIKTLNQNINHEGINAISTHRPGARDVKREYHKPQPIIIIANCLKLNPNII
ncbi:hypothetical protein HOG21_03270 [bacterium]|jgi:hypothetical protein|nr:hypothetical protein [bacterium]